MSNSLRNGLGAVFAVGLIGTGFELILLEHTEEFWQWSPIVLIGVALIMGTAAHVAPSRGMIKAFRGLMVLMVLSAAIGVWQHYAGNAEFELELYPSRAGFELFWESLKGATPALAPGMMMHLGLIGLAYTFKHPVFEGNSMKNLGTVAIALSCVMTAPLAAQVGNNMGVLNPNRASADELAGVTHISSRIANAIIEARPYLTQRAFDQTLGAHLSADQRAEVYRSLFLPINLNEASDEEILMVPGVGPRMHHEFEEYRPYVSLAQFRREIGKYVDDEELARMEQYVFVPIDLNSASDDAITSIPGVGSRMLHEFKEYRPYRNIEQFRREIGKYVDEDEVARFERYVIIRN